MNCPACGAALRLDDGKPFLRCDYCRGTYFPEKNSDGVRVLAEEASLACPRCDAALFHAEYAGLRIFYCSHCRGMLVPMGHFVALIDELKARRDGSPAEAPVAPQPDELRRHSNCPHCHRQMDTHFYGGPGNIVIDTCSPCRVNWLDAGELLRVVRAPERRYGQDEEDAGGFLA